MLNAIRKQAGSWIVKVLMLLLVASFAIWGIGDIFYGGGQNPTVATVGDAEIPASELSEAFERAVNNLQRQLGPEFDRERAIQLGVMQQALQSLVAQRLISLRAQEMGLAVPDDALRAMITGNPAFQSAGQFDRDRFDQLLRMSGLSEEGYLAALRQDLMRSALTGSIAGPVAAPPALVDALYRFRNEQRRGHYVPVAVASITDVPEPTEDELAEYHEAHQAEFTTPQYRALTFVTLEPQDLIDEVDISEEAIEAAYQSRIATYRTPERRTVQQLLAPDQATIEQAAARLAEGATPETVAAEIEGVSLEDLGAVTRGDLPPAFEDAIFAQAEGEIGQPVSSPFGWHVFRVGAIEPEKTVPLAEAREALAKELALEQASERLPDFAAQLDDELAAGTELAEAARALGLEAVQVPEVDARGRDPEGEPVAALPPWPEFMQVALETPGGETSLLEETDAGGYFVVHVDQVIEPRLRPVEEVREELRKAVQDERRRELARARAEELRAQLAGGAAADELLAEAGLDSKPIAPLRRDQPGTGQGVNPAVVRALFATPPGELAEAVVELGDAFAVVATDEVIAADPGADPEALEQLARDVANAMRSDVIAQFESQLRRDYPVEIDGAAINRVIGSDGLPPAGSAGTLPGSFF
jgi:peptidyl-prolyl cis-trans isomerase D